jgi:glutathione S-transferase
LSQEPHVTLFHSPHTRSTAALILLEELEANFDVRVLNMKAGEQRSAEYLAVNPMGKVPALMHDDALITEQVAIYIYLADLFSNKNMAPALNSPLRGPYLRWMVFYAACYEVAIGDKVMKHGDAPSMMSPYGNFDTMLSTIVAQLAQGPYMLGETFSAADILWGNGLRLGMLFKVVPELPAIVEYTERICSRPSFAKVAELDRKWIGEHAEASSQPETQ